MRVSKSAEKLLIWDAGEIGAGACSYLLPGMLRGTYFEGDWLIYLSIKGSIGLSILMPSIDSLSSTSPTKILIISVTGNKNVKWDKTHNWEKANKYHFVGVNKIFNQQFIKITSSFLYKLKYI